MSKSIRRAALAAAGVAALAAAIPLNASAGTERVTPCGTFQVVRPDPDAGFSAGLYRYQTFGRNTRETPTCNHAFHVLRSWLYDPDPSLFRRQGWDVGALRGGLRRCNGKRFVLRSSDGHAGFNVYNNC